MCWSSDGGVCVGTVMEVCVGTVMEGCGEITSNRIHVKTTPFITLAHSQYTKA